MSKKDSWEKPNLIVLGRGTPEEHVLSICKRFREGPGPGAIRNRCRVQTGDCQTRCES